MKVSLWFAWIGLVALLIIRVLAEKIGFLHIGTMVTVLAAAFVAVVLADNFEPEERSRIFLPLTATLFGAIFATLVFLEIPILGIVAIMAVLAYLVVLSASSLAKNTNRHLVGTLCFGVLVAGGAFAVFVHSEWFVFGVVILLVILSLLTKEEEVRSEPAFKRPRDGIVYL